MATVSLQSVRKSFGAVEVVKGVDLEIRDREFIVLVGPSGCGKTTLLRMVAGLEEISSGSLHIDGKLMNDIQPDARELAMVFQSYALYPHMSVADNMAFALRLAGVPKPERDRKVAAVARTLQLEPYLGRKPGQLSGGQRQRVAIGRAIVRQPKVFLFDEPLSNLDAALRVQMRVELARLHHELAATMIYVTHDQIEAMTMADRIVVLRAGVIEQVGTPMEIYQAPATAFVAGFIGSPKMNLIEAKAVRDPRDALALELADKSLLPLPAGTPAQAGAAMTVGVRPEALVFDAAGPVKGVVTVIEHLGGETLTYVDVGRQMLTVKTGETTPARVGDVVSLSFDPTRLHLFGPDGRAMRTS